MGKCFILFCLCVWVWESGGLSFHPIHRANAPAYCKNPASIPTNSPTLKRGHFEKMPTNSPTLKRGDFERNNWNMITDRI